MARLGGAGRRGSQRRALAEAPVVCAIGTTEPLAAAGLGADLAVLRALNVRPVWVVAAVSAQNSSTVGKTQALPAALIRAQLRSVWQQVTPASIVVGLLPEPKTISAVCSFLDALPARPYIVVDPVMTASTGQRLATRSALLALPRLLEHATITTPNAGELSSLTGLKVATAADARVAARTLHSLYGCAVLATGGHLREGEVADIMVGDAFEKVFTSIRHRRTMRGMGGILAAGIAARLARGDDLVRAVSTARRFVRSTLASARTLGHGRPQL